MANVRTGNVYYIDTASTGGPPATTNILDVKDIRVIGIHIKATATTAAMVLADNSASQPIIWDDALKAAGDSEWHDLSQTPIRFPNGVAVKTLTNATATLIIREANR